MTPDELTHFQSVRVILEFARLHRERGQSESFLCAEDMVALREAGAEVVSEGIQSGGETHFIRVRFGGFVFVHAALLPEAAAKYRLESDAFLRPAGLPC